MMQGHELHQLELAYAITVHKAQGGEAQHVVLLLSHHHSRMLTRRLLYTGAERQDHIYLMTKPSCSLLCKFDHKAVQVQQCSFACILTSLVLACRPHASQAAAHCGVSRGGA